MSKYACNLTDDILDSMVKGALRTAIGSYIQEKLEDDDFIPLADVENFREISDLYIVIKNKQWYTIKEGSVSKFLKLRSVAVTNFFINMCKMFEDPLCQK